jgi:hypothetical protein
MPKTSKKQRHEARRKAKKQEARRREAVSPVKRLAEAAGEIECWISDHFEERGQLQIFAYKVAAGLTGIAAFLVDRGVVGLKDAWHNTGIDREMLKSMMEGVEAGGVKMHRCKLEDARRWVAGPARWAHDNGMRLPKEWLKTALLIGGLEDWKSADVSGFLKEFYGHPEDLRQRLIGESFESYLDREDVLIEFSNDAPFMDHETGDYLYPDSDDDDFEDEPFDADAVEENFARFQESCKRMTDLLAAETARWLASQNEEPSSQLSWAWMALLTAQLVERHSEGRISGPQVVDRLLQDVDESLQEAAQLAGEQLSRHLTAEPDVAKNLADRMPDIHDEAVAQAADDE